MLSFGWVVWLGFGWFVGGVALVVVVADAFRFSCGFKITVELV